MKTQATNRCRIASDDDDFREVLECVADPVPHVERVNAVICVSRSIEMDVPGICRKCLFVLLTHHHRISGVRKDLFEEVDVAGVVAGMKLGKGWMEQNRHTTFSHNGRSAIGVEEVPKSQAGHQDRIHDGVDVVGRNVRKTHRHNVGLALDCNALLLPNFSGNELVNRFNFTGMNGAQRVG